MEAKKTPTNPKLTEPALTVSSAALNDLATGLDLGLSGLKVVGPAGNAQGHPIGKLVTVDPAEQARSGRNGH